MWTLKITFPASLLHILIITAAQGIASVLKDDNASILHFSDFDWASIQPSSDLEYFDCYKDYKCARLELPLDWKNISDPRSVVVAMMKIPAMVPDNDPTFAGSVFTNPGGPGGSGVASLPRLGHHLQKILDKPGKKHYEIISFDPRGIGFTTPLADCFGGDTFVRYGAALETRGTLGLDSGIDSLRYNMAIQNANAERCKRVDENGESIFEYLSTPSVVRDMVEMLDKIEELRTREGKDKGPDELELRKRSSEDVPRLQYVGFSYGTLLGNYFASMYPGRVHRMILDSVCDVTDYAHGPGWLKNIEDSDALFDEFLKGCHKAGPKNCELARGSDKSWREISQRVWDFVRHLDEEPQGIIDANGYNVIVKGRDFLSWAGLAIYQPVVTFKKMAQVFNEGTKGNFEPLISRSLPVPNLSNGCSLPQDSGNMTISEPMNGDALSGVLCSDGEDVTDKDETYWRKYIHKLTSMSKVLGKEWANLRFPCSKWPFKTNFQFNGPFTTPKADPARLPGRPSAPLLFLSNRFDPATPLSAARRMAKMHPGARVVVKESLGHGVLTPGAPSECMDTIVADYFDEGVVPQRETFCEAECGPWDDHCMAKKGGSSVFDAEYLEPPHDQWFPLMV